MSTPRSIGVWAFVFICLFAIGFVCLRHFTSSENSRVKKLALQQEAEKEFLNTDGTHHYRSPIRVPSNPGLPRFLESVRDSTLARHTDSNLVFLMVRKPAIAIDWSRFSDLLSGFLMVLAGEQQLDVGHVQWGWSCVVQGERNEGASGYTGEQRDQALDLVKKGWGASAVLMSFGDGVFESPWAVQVSYDNRSAENYKLLAMVTDQNSCAKFMAKYQDLRFKDRLKSFNLTNGFDLSTEKIFNCVNVAELLFSEVKNFPVEIFTSSFRIWKVPKSLFGRPSDPLPERVSLSAGWSDLLKDRQGQFVEISSALNSSAIETDETIDLKFNDTQKLFETIKTKPALIELATDGKTAVQE
jgi:hypothetical protein